MEKIERPKLFSVRQDILSMKDMSIASKLILQYLVSIVVMGDGCNPVISFNVLINKFGMTPEVAAEAVQELFDRGYILDLTPKRLNEEGKFIYEWHINTGKLESQFENIFYRF